MRAAEVSRFTIISEDSQAPSRVLIAANGDIVIQQQSEFHVRFYSPEGHQRALLGRRGSAPGEFIDPQSIGWIGDTLWLWDATRRVVTYASPEGRYIDEEGLHVGWGHLSLLMARVSPVALTQDGFVVKARTLPEVFNGRAPIHGYLISIGSFSYINHVFGVVPPTYGDSDALVYAGNMAPVPFRLRPLFAAADDGTRMAWLTPQPSDVGLAYQLTVMNGAADTLVARKYLFDRAPVPVGVMKQAVDTLAKRVGAENDLAFQAELLNHSSRVYSPAERLLFGQDGTIWLAGASSSAAQRWLMLNSFGTPVASVSLSSSARVVAARRDRMWAVESDSTHAVHLVTYQLMAAARIANP
jgi:hypothetical protein